MKFLGKLVTVVGVAVLAVVGALAQEEQVVINIIDTIADESYTLLDTVSQLNSSSSLKDYQVSLALIQCMIRF